MSFAKEKETLYIGVVGENDCSEEIYIIAEKVGYKIAESGSILVCGGKSGVMEATAKGVKKNGGTTIGILPSSTKEEANDFIDFPICTGLGQARNLLVVLNCDVLIAIGGEYGTLSEIALALKHNIPVVSLNSWSLDKIYSEIKNFYQTKTPEEAVERALKLSSEYYR